MTNLAKIVSLVALAATIVPSLLYFAGAMDHAAVKWATLAGTAVWFIATPLWMGRKLPVDATEVEI
jgi:hypothetical protein